jgi:hypothetical protein
MWKGEPIMKLFELESRGTMEKRFQENFDLQQAELRRKVGSGEIKSDTAFDKQQARMVSWNSQHLGSNRAIIIGEKIYVQFPALRIGRI